MFMLLWFHRIFGASSVIRVILSALFCLQQPHGILFISRPEKWERAGSMEPLRSANSTVTCLRSPSRGAPRGEDFLRQIWRSVGEGIAYLAMVEMRGTSGCLRCGCSSVANPDQDALIFIHRQALAVNEFLLEVLQRCVIELELSLECAIGQAAPLAQEGDHLV